MKTSMEIIVPQIQRHSNKSVVSEMRRQNQERRTKEHIVGLGKNG